jgi:hypothetical protein
MTSICFGGLDISGAFGTFPKGDTIPITTLPRPPGQVTLTAAKLEQDFSEALGVLKKAESRSPVGAVSHAAAVASVYLNQPRLPEPIQPKAVDVGEYSAHGVSATSSLSGLSWTGWGEATATGTGQALIRWGNRPEDQATVAAVVSVSGRESCDGVLIYTSLTMQPAAGVVAPSQFALVERDIYLSPCQVHGGSYVAGRDERTQPQDCFFTGLSNKLLFGSIPSYRFGAEYCAMRWVGWGTPTAVGIGVARKTEWQYGVRVRLSHPAWCSAWTVSYTQETIELWGKGEPLLGLGAVSRASERRLEARIGRKGQPHWVVHGVVVRSGGCLA